MSKDLFSEKAKAILKFLQKNEGEYTAKDIARETGLTSPQVNGTITASLQAKGFTERVVKKGFKDKIIILTDAGKAINPDAIIEDTE